MEEIHNLVTGCFKLNIEQIRPDGDEEEEEGDSEELQFLPYRDVVSSGASLVQYHKPRRVTGLLLDLRQTHRVVAHVAGNFHLQEPWWQLTILRTKKSRDKVVEAKDYWALCYRLRDDPGSIKENVVHMFLRKVLQVTEEQDAHAEAFFQAELNKFYEYLSQRGQYDDLSLYNLEDRVTEFVDSCPEEDKGPPQTFKRALLLCNEFRYIQASRAHPQMFHYLSQLFPGHFLKLLTVHSDKYDKLAEVFDENPGLMAFKEMLKKHCGLLGFETSSEALIKAGLMGKVPLEVKDAIYMYEYLKKETRENGHTCILYDKILDTLRSQVVQFEEGLDFLNSNKITKTVVEAGHRLVYLMTLWKAENQIVKGITSLITSDLEQPWRLEVDWDREDYEGICQDADQRRAGELITTVPVVAISGKGGCGKTYVVTKITTTAKVNRVKPTKPEAPPSAMECGDCYQSDTKGDNPAMDTDNIQPEGDISLPCEEPGPSTDCDADSKAPDNIEMLLTAPTGKAANLLGKRAKMDSFTLHQVIYSYRLKPPEAPWRHEKVNTLVVDECSLVSVSTFAFLIELLLKHACLRKVILLGDVRQLPSIEPGNFLADTFAGLSRLGYAIELRTNHRAESQMIVDNATRISKKMYPVFDTEKFMLRRLPESNPSSSGNDYTEQDILEDVRRLLTHKALSSHVTSQFVSFTRRVCDSINDLCCKHYNEHRMKEDKKFVFRTGDKVCCTKNGYVNLYTYDRGRMICQLKDSKGENENSEGGVNRMEPGEEAEETSLLEQQGDQSAGAQLDGTIAGPSTQAGRKQKKDTDAKKKQIRLSNGEIFFILDEKEINDESGNRKAYLQLSDKDPQDELMIWVDRKQLRQACKIRHAWARTIHTFQGSENDTIVYIVGNRSWRQNWQHVYTAVTRGRKSVFIVSPESTLRNAVKRSEIKRQTSLKKQLIEKLQKNKTTREILGPGTPVKSQIPTNQNVQHNLHQHVQPPIRRQLTSNHGDTSMNSTQEVTDILASLAEEHGSPGGTPGHSPSGSNNSAGILDYDSDDVFTRIKPSTSKALPQSYTNTVPKQDQHCKFDPHSDHGHSSKTHAGTFSNILLENQSTLQTQDIANNTRDQSIMLPSRDDSSLPENNITDVDSDDTEKSEENTDSYESDDSQSLLSPANKTNSLTKTRTNHQRPIQASGTNMPAGLSMSKGKQGPAASSAVARGIHSDIPATSDHKAVLDTAGSQARKNGQGMNLPDGSVRSLAGWGSSVPDGSVKSRGGRGPGEDIEMVDSDTDSDSCSQSLLSSPVDAGTRKNSIYRGACGANTTQQSDTFINNTVTNTGLTAGAGKSRLSLRGKRHSTEVKRCKPQLEMGDQPVTALGANCGDICVKDSAYLPPAANNHMSINTGANRQHLDKGTGVFTADDSPFSHYTPSHGGTKNITHRRDTVNNKLKDNSPVTPLLYKRNNFSPEGVHNAVKTSSPFGMGDNSAAEFQYHICTGLSPLEPGCDESFPSFRQKSSYSAHHSVCSPIQTLENSVYNKADETNDALEGTRSSIGKYKGIQGLNDTDDVIEPRSNESNQSQWSEVDESEYIHLAEVSTIESKTLQAAGTTPNADGLYRKGPQSLLTHHRLTSRPSPTGVGNLDMSSTSQWSEADDDQLLTLDLDDITSMTQNLPNYEVVHTSKHNRTSINQMSTPVSTMSSSLFCNIQTDTSRVTNVGSSPLLSDTSSTASSSISSSPRSVSSSPRKRPYPTNEDPGLSVSPLKRSLSQLRFK